jgi:hypothetical protein
MPALPVQDTPNTQDAPSPPAPRQSDAFIHSALAVRSGTTTAWVGSPSRRRPGYSIYLTQVGALERGLMVGDVVDLNAPGYSGLGKVVEVGEDEVHSTVFHVQGCLRQVASEESGVYDSFWVVLVPAEMEEGDRLVEYAPRTIPRKLSIRVYRWQENEGVNVRWLSI